MIAVLAGGTGGAKLAAGMYELVGRELAVVANTGDDVEVYGVHVSPDPDLIAYWLAGVIDARGWGLADDTFEVMAALRAAGHPAWFQLGDRDLAMCLLRTERLRAGASLTDAHAAVVEALGVEARVLPASDDPVRTFVRSGGRWRSFQEFMIVDRAAGPIEVVELRGAEAARASDKVLAALGAADAIVIGPSNPVISIGPILAVRGVREALAVSRAPVVAVSPLVGGRVLKGPTAAFMRAAGLSVDVRGVAAAYAGVIDGLVTDEGGARLPVPSLEAPVLMDNPEGRRRVAAAALELAEWL